jgi:ectoine hydroxylase-related dioxygenase (phytanoyl-CoA dioxygenase family)
MLPTAADVASFQRDGHVLLRSVASPDELIEHRSNIRAATLAASASSRPLHERDTYGKAFLQVWNLWRRDPAVAKFVLSTRFAGVAAALLGVDRVRVYHDQALFKEAGGGHTPWHQDAVYWPLDGTRCITMWMPLIDIDPEMGGVTFASGTNSEGSLGDVTISDDSDQHFESVLSRAGFPLVAPVAMAAGDATFHGGWTLHRADPNRTPVMREVMTIIWFADGLTVREPINDAQRHDLATWLPGLVPGDLAASELNPLC